MRSHFDLGSIWDSKDGKRSVIIVSSDQRYIGYQNIDTGRYSRIERHGLRSRYVWRGANDEPDSLTEGRR